MLGDRLLAVADDSVITAFDAVDGAEAWRYRFKGDLLPTLVGDKGWVVAASRSGRIVGIDLASGLAAWETASRGQVLGHPVVADDRVYIVDSALTVLALSLTDGTEQWSYKLDAPPTATLAAGYGMVYVPGGDGVIALNATLGREAWRYEADNPTATQPALLGPLLLVLDTSGRLTAIDATRGDCGPDRSWDCKTIWFAATPRQGTGDTTLTVGDGFIALTDSNRIYILECSSCQAGVPVDRSG
jgi:hypothetical protein